MRAKPNCLVAFAALSRIVAAEKGAALIHGCVWHNTNLAAPYTVNWHPGSSSDKCMRLIGSAAHMLVAGQGLTCQTLGTVAVDSDGLCYFKESWWGLSYTSDVAYSGSTDSQWTTGPANSDITLHDQSPGTNVCASAAQCYDTSIEWPNDGNGDLYFVFEPEVVR
ncbi:hypothetical protein O1611_g2615 [Lasiodiplodia mahajangana]|uniref:Uncharacterized protein n=1 Tax=Lasiodiplodia mahajangana TaxID=1108764 RepID=A0ACC2JU65_9PEZI|nr:hypothetical protein O1611_g2615 [Lasiodiplodia mahajangana]